MFWPCYLPKAISTGACHTGSSDVPFHYGLNTVSSYSAEDWKNVLHRVFDGEAEQESTRQQDFSLFTFVVDQFLGKFLQGELELFIWKKKFSVITILHITFSVVAVCLVMLHDLGFRWTLRIGCSSSHRVTGIVLLNVSDCTWGTHRLLVRWDSMQSWRILIVLQIQTALGW